MSCSRRPPNIRRTTPRTCYSSRSIRRTRCGYTGRTWSVGPRTRSTSTRPTTTCGWRSSRESASTGASMRYALQRVGYAILVMFLASIVTFLGLRVAPGNVTSSIYNPTTTPPEVIAELKRSLGLDQPLLVQYWHYLERLVTGDFG